MKSFVQTEASNKDRTPVSILQTFCEAERIFGSGSGKERAQLPVWAYEIANKSATINNLILYN
eukprot:TRINITY_DN1529_c0_g1_i1.p1 TRINITY_DN1529_c0_g1~~TRINITY_DN1529_c0_g1_i1.p1  ORF type:complete len:63 (+),score=4.23 TRINITY_DN1529_c0_g1_i1:237-425(+)